jgi:alpha-galactosidase
MRQDNFSRRIKNLLHLKYAITGVVLFLLLSCNLNLQAQTIKEGKWQIAFNLNSGTANIYFDNQMMLENAYSEVKTSFSITSKDFAFHHMTRSPLGDGFGKGTKYVIEHTGKNKYKMIQTFCFYPKNNYFIVDIALQSDKEVITTNYMAPLKCELPDNTFFKRDNRILFVPFDNDKWVRYDSHSLNNDLTSYEVSAIYDNNSRNGLVMGSISHDTWKTGIVFSSEKPSSKHLDVVAGITSELTRDVLPHGSLKGNRVSSPKIFVGYFEDWRAGMETYAKANTVITPTLAWNKGKPFGWNSWGKIQTNLSRDKACEVSAFFSENLQPNGFKNVDNIVYLDLDSFWDKLSEKQLKEYVDSCKTHGQVPGIYWAPFTDWGKDSLRTLNGTGYKYKDVYLYAHGKPIELDGAWAVDPTHPGVRNRIDQFTEKFKRLGFRYLKIDFLTHGSFEADHYYDQNIRTGMQCYNNGMNYLLNKLGSDFYITMAISPLFPSQYAHSRRIACDAFYSIKDTEYTLNATTYGWWLSYAYKYNDPDHIVLEGGTDGENRARITSGAITGIFMSGDDFSLSGNESAKIKARKFLTNPDINKMARIEKSFRPVECDSSGASEMFTYFTGKECYLAVFNYSANPKRYDIDFKRIGLVSSKDYTIKELWSGVQTRGKGKMNVVIAGKDAVVYKFNELQQ